MVRVVAIATATLTASFSQPKVAFALGSAQTGAFLLGRLIERPQILDPLLSVAALFVAPFSAVFLLCPLAASWVYLRRNTSWFNRRSSIPDEVMTTIRALSSQGDLDPVIIARSLLEELQRLNGFTGAAVSIDSRTLASIGQVDEASIHQPLTLNGKAIGQISLAGVSKLSATAQTLLDEAAARLQTAILFTEARSIATSSERSRMARDMHDGVSQELTSLGYLIDDLLATAPEEIRPEIRGLRNELSRVISELRLSIFELRSSAVDTIGLAAALADYIQQTRLSTPFKIHLSVDEGTERLAEEVEAELLRIIQEAVANARRHSQAENLWINCQIRAPLAQILIEDDGIGLQQARQDSFGIGIMRERATQIGATVTLSDRRGGGTRVSVDLGP